MAKTKKMDEAGFQKILKEITVQAETIRARQNQKQSAMNDFEKQRSRFKTGKISKSALSATVPKVKKELDRLDKNIRVSIKRLQKTADRVKKFAGHQSPKKEKVSISGLKQAKKPKKSSSKKKKRR